MKIINRSILRLLRGTFRNDELPHAAFEPMKKGQLLLASALAATALGCLVSPVYGDTQSFTVDYGSVSSPLAVADSVVPTSDFPVDVAIPKFDTALGALSDITITMATDGILQAEVFNIGSAPVGFTGAAASGTITVTGPNGTESSVTLATTPFDGSVPSGSISTPGFVLGPAATGVGTGISDVSSADFSAYESASSGVDAEFPLSADFSSTLFSGTGEAFFGGSTGAYGSVEVTYTYAATEPWTLWPELSLVGFCAIAGLGRVGCGRPGATLAGR